MSSEVIKDLVRQAKNGSTAAFGELYARYSGAFYRFAYYQTGSPARAEDAVSDAVLQAFEKIRQLEKAEAFQAWMFAILRNCCRKQQREKHAAAQTVPLDMQTDLPAAAVDQSENAALYAALARLGDDERELFLLSVLCGYNSRELAAIVDARPGTVRSRLSRVRAKLQTLLKE